MQIQSDLIVKNGSTDMSAGTEKAKVSSEGSLYRMRLPANSAGSEDALHQLKNNGVLGHRINHFRCQVVILR